MSEPRESAEKFFAQDRGERALYENAAQDETVLLPLSRDGFEALLARAVGLFSPPLPIDDSCRKVLSGYVHHIANETNTTTIELISKVIYKSLTNALTWTIDQEIKAKNQAEFAAHQAKMKAEADEKAKAEALDKAATKRQKKATKYTVKSKSDEAKAN